MMNVRIRSCLLASILLASPVVATVESPPVQPETASPTLDKRIAGLGDFVDGAMAAFMANREVAGAVVAVVSDGQILFTNSYGYADIDQRTPVTAQTLFRPGSVSKLVTWVALMQLVEQGKVDLDADINRYLDYKVPEAFGQPIRVRDLFSHSGGFEDRGDITVASPDDFVPLAQFMRENIPDRVRPPGEISYSNYGSAIAGYIVERVSGELFPDYVERYIFGPLGMRNATFREPLSPDLAPGMAKGYVFEDGRFTAQPFEYYANIMPAGSMSAAAPDMARFAIMLLQDGRYGNTTILKPETARLMRKRLQANAPSLPGMAYGFFEVRTANPRILGHGGNTRHFHSNMTLVPSENLGFFMSFTGGKGASVARTELVNALVGRLFPEERKAAWAGSAGPDPSGVYRTNRRTYSSPTTPGMDIRVTRLDGAQLETEHLGSKTLWEQVGPRLYQRVNGAAVGGPHELLETQGEGSSRSLSFGLQPHVLYHIVDAGK